MKQFTIRYLEEGWEWEDLQNVDLLDYCTHELAIPNEYLTDASSNEQTLKLSLEPDPAYYNDDWFINLLRITA